MGYKNCSKIRTGKCASPINPQPLSNFRIQKGRKLGRSLCISCENKYTHDHRAEAIARYRKWHRENKERTRQRKRLDFYGLSPERFDAMLVSQSGCCAICNVHHSQMNQALNVDHCHKTNQVRGLLCNKCNRGLGLFNDDIYKMNVAIKYLESKKT
jgi:hypothetical protein